LGLQLSPTPNMGVHLGVWGFIPSHSLDSLHSREHVMWLSGLLLGPQPRNLLALVASQMLGLRQFRDNFETLTWESWEKEPFGCSLGGASQRILYGGRWWLPPSPGRGVSCGPKCPWLVPTPKGVPECELTTWVVCFDADSSLIY
jgi:hypothetical protein